MSFGNVIFITYTRINASAIYIIWSYISCLIQYKFSFFIRQFLTWSFFAFLPRLCVYVRPNNTHNTTHANNVTFFLCVFFIMYNNDKHFTQKNIYAVVLSWVEFTDDYMNSASTPPEKSWNFCRKISRTWKVRENDHGPGEPCKSCNSLDGSFHLQIDMFL